MNCVLEGENMLRQAHFGSSSPSITGSGRRDYLRTGLVAAPKKHAFLTF